MATCYSLDYMTNSFAYTSFGNLPFASSTFFLPLLSAIALWTLIIKGYALWYSARNGQKWWFIFLLIISAFGIPEVIYLLFFRADKLTKGTPAPAAAPSRSPSEEV